MKRFLLIQMLLLQGVFSNAYEITPVSDDTGTIWIIENLREDLPAVLFAMDRDTYAETTAQLQEYAILQEDDQRLKSASQILQQANTNLWEENQDLQRKVRIWVRVAGGSAVVVLLTLTSVLIAEVVRG